VIRLIVSYYEATFPTLLCNIKTGQMKYNIVSTYRLPYYPHDTPLQTLIALSVTYPLNFIFIARTYLFLVQKQINLTYSFLK